jgi:hypothetical protein
MWSGKAMEPAGDVTKGLESHLRNFAVGGALHFARTKMWNDIFAESMPVLEKTLGTEACSPYRSGRDCLDLSENLSRAV